MSVPNGMALHVVEREPEGLPFVAGLLQRWMEREFEPLSCRAVLEELLSDARSGATERLLRPAAVTEGGVIATDALLFPEVDWQLRFVRMDAASHRCIFRAAVRYDDSAFDEGARVVHMLSRGCDPSQLRAEASWLGERVLGELARVGASAEADFEPIVGPGIYRREHGSVVIRSRTTSLVLDPVSFWMPHAPRRPIRVEEGVDAILVTHGHADHWSIPSILAHTSTAKTKVVVPPVPRTSILAPNDMLRTLRRFGQDVIAPAWGTSITIGDIDVEILPFFGEQPVRDGSGPEPQLRNWGSCYRFDTPEFSGMALIDSGVDPLGNMADVVRASCEKHGPVDFVMSSLPRFHSPFFFGLPHYYLTLPFERLRSLFAQYRKGVLPSVTPGPAGLVSICAAAGARYYVPYGNGFEGVGEPISDVGIGIGEPAEAELVRQLDGRLANARVPTTAISWNPGDRLFFRDGVLVRKAYSS